MATTAYEYALLCVMSSHRESYKLNELSTADRAKHDHRASTLEQYGWRPLKTSEELGIQRHGYFGVAYYKVDPTTGEVEVVIAHRGTCLTNTDRFGNILADIEIAQQQTPKILHEAAFPYVNALFRHNFYSPAAPGAPKPAFSINSHPVTKITHDGFSLGGFTAGACAALSNIDMHAMTFDAPGIACLNFDKAAKAPRINNFVTTPNLVNTCNRQVGAVKQLTAFVAAAEAKQDAVHFELEFNDFGFSAGESLSPHHSSVDLENYLLESRRRRQKMQLSTAGLLELGETVKSHNLDSLISTIEANNRRASYHPVYRWPVAETEMVYGATPSLGNISTFGWNDGWTSFFSAISIVAQSSKAVLSAVLWEISKRQNIHGEHEGIIAVKHRRSNKVFYTQEEYQTEQFSQLFVGLLRIFVNTLQQLQQQPAPVAAAPALGPPQRALPFSLAAPPAARHHSASQLLTAPQQTAAMLPIPTEAPVFNR
jgi:hypothetical protein